MSKLCKLKSKTYGELGLWAYGEIIRLRAERDEQKELMQAANEEIKYLDELLELVRVETLEKALQFVATVRAAYPKKHSRHLLLKMCEREAREALEASTTGAAERTCPLNNDAPSTCPCEVIACLDNRRCDESL
jgi:hypothetical protein